MLENKKVPPEEITAVTFTNEAAGEIRERIDNRDIQIGTFHAICLQFLKDRGRSVFLADERICIGLAKEILAQYRIDEEAKTFLAQTEAWKADQILGGKDRRS